MIPFPPTCCFSALVFVLGAAPPQEQSETLQIPADNQQEEGEEEEEEPTPVAEKDAPIPPASEEGNGDSGQADGEEEGEEEEEPLKVTENENVKEEEEETEEKVEEEQVEEKQEEDGDIGTEAPKTESQAEVEAAVEEEESKEQEWEEYEEIYDDEDDDDTTTTADLFTDSTSPVKQQITKTISAKTNGHVLLVSESLRQNPGTPPTPSPTPEPVLCPLVESELSYTDRDISLSSGYEMYNGEVAEPALTNGSSEQHRAAVPLFPDLPLDPEPGNPVPVGTVDIGTEPATNSPTADRSRTVSSSSTGDTPKGRGH